MKKVSLNDIKSLVEWRVKCATTVMNSRAAAPIFHEKDFSEIIWELAKYVAKEQIMAELNA